MIFRKTLFTTFNTVKLIAVILISAVISISCSDAEFNGDILAALEENNSSTVEFKKDAKSEVAFVMQFKIGNDYSAEDLPSVDAEEVLALKPGFDLIGWKPAADSTNNQFYTLDKKGFIQSFHMTANPFTVYGDFTASKNTPYKIIYKTQNVTMDGYELYQEKEMTGTTSTPEAPSYTDAASNVISITGFTAQTAAITEKEIAADGSTTVEIFYDRNQYTLTLHKNDTNAGSPSEETVTEDFWFGVPKHIPANTFTYTGHSFGGWAETTAKAAAFTVDYQDGVYYTIGDADAHLYAVWLLPQISVTIHLPAPDEVGITYEISSDGKKLILSAVLPTGATAADYDFSWYYPSEGFNVKSTASTWEINIDQSDPASLDPGDYQVSLIAVRRSDSMPSGISAQIHVD